MLQLLQFKSLSKNHLTPSATWLSGEGAGSRSARRTGAACPGPGTCWQGNCVSHSIQCQLLWGPAALPASPHCFALNTLGNQAENCEFKDKKTRASTGPAGRGTSCVGCCTTGARASWQWDCAPWPGWPTINTWTAGPRWWTSGRGSATPALPSPAPAAPQAGSPSTTAVSLWRPWPPPAPLTAAVVATATTRAAATAGRATAARAACCGQAGSGWSGSECCFAFVIFTHVFVRSKIRNIQTFASVVYFIVNMDAVKTG